MKKPYFDLFNPMNVFLMLAHHKQVDVSKLSRSVRAALTYMEKHGFRTEEEVLSFFEQSTSPTYEKFNVTERRQLLFFYNTKCFSPDSLASGRHYGTYKDQVAVSNLVTRGLIWVTLNVDDGWCMYLTPRGKRIAEELKWEDAQNRALAARQ